MINKRISKFSIATLIWTITFSSGVFAAEYNSIDLAKSKITFTSKLMGSKLAGSFGKFSGKVTFNSGEPEKSKANLVIDLSSFNAGGEELQDEAKGKDWFNTKAYPAANFVSESVKVVGANSLEIQGLLTMKGKSVPVLVVAKYQSQGKQMVFDASFQLLRLDYGLGLGTWSDTAAVANEVPVKVILILNQK
jgi:polyisoprenoid-binding protein YceI